MSEQNEFKNMSVDEVLELVESGQLTPEKALEIEKAGKNRKTLIAHLEKIIEPESSDPSTQDYSEQQPETAKVVFLVNTKHNWTLYRAGQKADVSQTDYDILMAAGVISLVEG